MSDKELQINPSTKVGELLDRYPELEDILIRMAPPFKKLKNPLLRKSIAKVATLQQAAMAGRLDLVAMVNQLRHAVGQPPLDSTEAPSSADYLGSAPEWFDDGAVAVRIDDRNGDSETMAITRIVKELNNLGGRQVVELATTFLPAPGIDVARKRGLTTWTVEVEPGQLYKSYFTRQA